MIEAMDRVRGKGVRAASDASTSSIAPRRLAMKPANAAKTDYSVVSIRDGDSMA
jgi:hypothetical protein